MTADTKAGWKRRALRAEAELDSARKMLQFLRCHGDAEHRIHALNQVALQEIREALHALDRGVDL